MTTISAPKRQSRALPLLAIALALALAGGCSRGGDTGSDAGAAAPGKPKQEETRVPVEVAVARRETITASFQGTATLEADAQAQVVTKAAGVILKINVEEGDIVRKGEVLAVLDSDRQRLNLQQIRATLNKLENDFSRQRELYERKLIGQDIFDRSRFDLEQQKAAYASAELELSYTQIVAPISGVVSRRLVKVGNLIQLNQPLFEVDDFDPLLAVLSVPEREMQRIAADQPVQMLVDARPGEVFLGRVQRVSPVVEAGSGTFRVTAEFRDDKLRPGMFGRLNVVYDTRDNALVIPREALLGEGADAAVFVVENDVAKRVTVQLGHIGDGKAEILTGLADEARVITLGQAAIRDGVKVQVIQR